MGGHHLPRTERTGLGGTGSPAQGVFGASCKAYGGPSSSENRAHRPGGGRGVQPRGCSEPPARPMGGHHLRRTGRTGLGGTGCPAQGVFGASCKAYGGPSSSGNQEHGPGGDGESSPGGVQSLLQGPWGPASSENRAHRPGGDGKSSPGSGRSLLQGPWGTIIFQEPGAPARGGTGSPSRGVVGAFFRGGRRALWGQWGGSRLVGVGPPAWGGGGGRSGAGSNRGAPSGGACREVRARQLRGPWTAPRRWMPLCSPRTTRSRRGVGPPHQQGPGLGPPAKRPY